MSEKKVIKHSASIQITNTVNIFQRRLWNILLANSYYKLPSAEFFTISFSELKKVINFGSNNYDYLKESLIELIGSVVEWNVLEKDKKTKWKAFGLLASAKIEDGILTYSYSKELQKMLYNPKIYARISLSIQNKFKSKHSLSLYELFLDYFIANRNFGQTPVIELELFRHLLGFTRNKKKPVTKSNLDRYTIFKHLNNKVIKPSIEEINKNTEINVRIEYKKRGKKVTGLQFFIKPKNKMLEVAVESEGAISEKKLQDLSVAIETVSDNKQKNILLEKVISFGLSEDIAEKILKNKSEEEILSDIAYINKNKLTKKNLGGYALVIFNNRKMSDEEKKQKERKIIELQKQDSERLEYDYEIYIKDKINKFKKNLPESELEDIKLQSKEIVKKKIESGELKKSKFISIFETSAENQICKEKIEIFSKKEFLEKYKGKYKKAEVTE